MTLLATACLSSTYVPLLIRRMPRRAITAWADVITEHLPSLGSSRQTAPLYPQPWELRRHLSSYTATRETYPETHATFTSSPKSSLLLLFSQMAPVSATLQNGLPRTSFRPSADSSQRSTFSQLPERLRTSISLTIQTTSGIRSSTTETTKALRLH